MSSEKLPGVNLTKTMFVVFNRKYKKPDVEPISFGCTAISLNDGIIYLGVLLGGILNIVVSILEWSCNVTLTLYA